MIFLRSFWKTIIWICIVLFLSLYSGEDLPDARWLMFPHIDKVIHFMMYFIFVLALIHDSQHYGKIRWKPYQIILISVMAAISLGGMMEALQQIPAIHRNGDFFDFLANAVGAVVAAVSYGIFEPLLNKIKNVFMKS